MGRTLPPRRAVGVGLDLGGWLVHASSGPVLSDRGGQRLDWGCGQRSCERSPGGRQRESRRCYLGLLFVEDTSSETKLVLEEFILKKYDRIFLLLNI